MKKTGKILLAAAAMVMMTGCSQYKTTEGKVNEAVKTMFYNFTVNGAYMTQSIDAAVPSAGNVFVVVNITVENTYKGTLSMTDGHFQLQTISAEESADASASPDVTYAIPITSKNSTVLLEDELPATYDLAEKETRTGTLIFEMPSTESVFNFCTADYFNYANDSEVTTGNTFFVTITPETKGSIA